MVVKRRSFAQARKAAGYTQESLAERLGVDRTTVARWEAGETEPHPRQRLKIAEAFGLSLCEFAQLLSDVGTPGHTVEVSASPVEAPVLPDAAHTLLDEMAATASVLGVTWEEFIRWLSRRLVLTHGVAATVSPVLGSDTELGFRRPLRSRSTVADVNRQKFIRAALGAGAVTVAGLAAFADLITPTQPTPVPSVVGWVEVAEVRNAAQAFSGLDNLYGGGVFRDAVVAQLRYCAELLNARCSDRVRADLFSAVGHLAQVTGFMAFDAYAHDDARRMFRFALYCAEESGDWHLRAKVLSGMARQEIWCGDPDTGLTFIELAMVRADRLTATERTMLHTGRARALAKLGRVQDTASAVGVADEEFSHARPANDPVYVRYYDAAQHAGVTGDALGDVAVHGHFIIEARHRLSTAVTGFGEEFARSRVMDQIKLASLVMVTGDPGEAAMIGGQALDAAATIRSRRVADDMRALSSFGEPHKGLAEVDELIHRIGSAVQPPRS